MAIRKKRLTIDREKLPRFFAGKEQEEKWDRYWEERQIYRYDPARNREDTFMVDTPPPTVSGSLHIGHVFSYAHTDFIVRFQRMCGKNIFYPMGWDDNGLPTERRVQRYYHVSCDPAGAYIADFEARPANAKMRKKRPRQISRKNFIELCNGLTLKDEKAFQALWKRLGLSVDWTLEYATISTRARSIAQLSFLDLYEKGHIYSRYAPIMWDVDFQTSIAQAEVKERLQSGWMYDLRFPTEAGQSPLVISTTRPELLPACVGIACHPEDQRYRAFVGQQAITPLFGVKVPIFASDQVDPEKGTGLVMVCTFGDATDVEWWQKEQLPLRQIIGLDGRLLPLHFGSAGWESEYPEDANRYYGQLAGSPVHKARELILELLRTAAPAWQGFISRAGEARMIERAVKYYEKGERPLEWIPTRQWFVHLLDKKEDLIRMGRQIGWHPGFFSKRFENWTNNLQYDWNISRQRFFGVPLPIWYRLDEEGDRIYEDPIFPDMEQLPVDPMADIPPGYTDDQRDQPLGFQGEPDVFDTWFTSSMSPYIATGGASPTLDGQLLPFDIRPQSHEIIRTWAFYTIAKTLLHEGKIPWKDVLISGWILDPDRKKMGKTTGNVETPEPWMDRYSADAVRYWAARAKLGVDTGFDPKMMKIGQRLVTKIFNVAKFVYHQEAFEAPIQLEIDKGFIASLRQLVAEVTRAFAAFDHAKALTLTETFFWKKFTDTYVELVKRRTFDEHPDHWEARASAVAALRLGLQVLLRLFAPFLPYITEEVWSWMAAEETNTSSIHLAGWPTAKDFAGIEAPRYPHSFNTTIACLESIHRYKARMKASVGSEMKRLHILTGEDRIASLEICREDLQRAARAEQLVIGTGRAGEDLAEAFFIEGEMVY